MSERTLKVERRHETGKEAAKKLRQVGNVPAVAYGHKEEPVKLTLNAKELRDMLKHGGKNGLIRLQLQDGGNLPVIIKALQKHPLTHEVQSVDFLNVRLDEKVTASVPIVLEGEPVGVKVDGGILVQSMHTIEVEAFPQDIPEAIHVDVSGLEFNGAPILVKDVTFPQGVTSLGIADDDIAVVNPPDAEPIVEEEVDASAVPATEVDGPVVTDQTAEENSPGS